MQINERLQFITYRVDGREIVAAGRRGGLYRLTLDLELIARSEISENDKPICAMAIYGDFAFTRDSFGTICRWDLQTLRPIDVLVSGEARDSSQLDGDDAVVPSICHALTVEGGMVYVTNGFGQILELCADTFKLQRIIDPNKESFTETIELSVEGRHILSDFNGWLWFGDIKTGSFERRIRLDQGPVHCVRYDRRHDRYWATTDNQGGFKIVDRAGASAILVKMTTDDVEWIDFDATQSKAYVACFDHHLYIYDNSSVEPTLKNIVGPFKYQLKQVVHVSDSDVFVLLQSGEVFRLDAQGQITAKSDFEGQAVWGLDAHPNSPGTLYCAMEDGSVATVSCTTSTIRDHIELTVIARQSFSFGRLRRAIPFADGSYVAISAHGIVFRAGPSGAILWHRRVLGLCRDVAISRAEDKVLVGTEAGLVLEFNAASGSSRRTIDLSDPVWCVIFGDRDELVVGHRRKKISVFPPEGQVALTTIETRENLKRFRRLASGNIIVNGPEGIVEIDTTSWTIVKRFSEWVLQTCENSLVIGNRAFGVHYNLALITYDYDTCAPIEAQISVQDYPLGMAPWIDSGGKDYILIGGRGGYLSVFRLEAGLPKKVRDLYL